MISIFPGHPSLTVVLRTVDRQLAQTYGRPHPGGQRSCRICTPFGMTEFSPKCGRSHTNSGQNCRVCQLICQYCAIYHSRQVYHMIITAASSEEHAVVYAAVSSLSLSFFATAVDSVFDPMSNVLLWWLHRVSTRLDTNKWPVGGARLETIGNICYGTIHNTFYLLPTQPPQVSCAYTSYLIHNHVPPDVKKDDLCQPYRHCRVRPFDRHSQG